MMKPITDVTAGIEETHTDGCREVWMSQEIQRLAKAVGEQQAEIERLKDEKQRRVYYQDIVYAVCNIMDRYLPKDGVVVCGTIEHPSTDVQTLLEILLKPEADEETTL